MMCLIFNMDEVGKVDLNRPSFSSFLPISFPMEPVITFRMDLLVLDKLQAT